MRLSHFVTAEDCREARRLQREAIKQAAIDPVTGTIDINILTTGIVLECISERVRTHKRSFF